MDTNANKENKEKTKPVEKTCVEQCSLSGTRLWEINGDSAVLPREDEQVKIGSGIISSVLGSGGMAKVYKVWNEKLEVFRAVKILKPDRCDLKNRFETEVKISAKLHHPNIVEIYNVGEWNGLPYIEMEYVNGKSLEELIREKGKLPDEVCSSIMILVSRALYYAHSLEILIYGKTYHGVIHRDLKPANIMISEKGEVRLMDFGIARPTEVSLHTIDGSIVGTIQYLSPEQMNGREVDCRTDIYSLGAILYEMLTGEKTFPQESITELMKKRISNEFRKFSEYAFDISPELSRISQKCLNFEKQERYDSAKALLDKLNIVHKSITPDSPEVVLAEYLEGSLTVRPPQKRISRLHRKYYFIGGAVLAGVAFLFFISTKPEKSALSEPTPEPIASTTKTTFQTNQIPVALHPDSLARDKGINTVSEKKPVDPIHNENKSTPIKQPVVTKPELSPVDILKKKYKNPDMFVIASNAIQKKAFYDAILALENLPDHHPQRNNAKIMLLESYLETNRLKRASSLVKEVKSHDAQFHYLCGILFEKQGNSTDALGCYQQALIRPGRVRETQKIRRDALYNIAVLRSGLHRKNPTENTRVQAINAWIVVKRTYSAAPDHFRLKKADDELAALNKE